jgi:hypothetical protein
VFTYCGRGSVLIERRKPMSQVLAGLHAVVVRPDNPN